jgi:hypothetical protein
VAFQAQRGTGERGVFTGAGGPISTIADSSGPLASFGDPSINNAGTVAFFATLDAGGQGIFTGADPGASKIIATGYPLFGSTVTRLDLFGLRIQPGLNDGGSVAFVYQLADFRIGIARADVEAAAVPEPSSLALLTLGVAGLVLQGWRRRRA